MKNYLSFVLCVAAVLVVSSSAEATLLFYEGFDYSPSSNINGTGGWIDPVGHTGVSATGLSYAGLATTGGSAEKANLGSGGHGSGAGQHTYQLAGSAIQDLFRSESSTWYWSYLRGTKDGSGYGERANFYLNMHDGIGNKTVEGINIGTTGGATYQISDIGGGEGNGVGPGGDPTGTCLIVMRVRMLAGEDKMSGIMNPDLVGGGDLDEADWTAAEAFGVASGEITASSSQTMDWLGFNVGSWPANANGDNTLIDEIRIGTTLADVIPVPEPVTLTVLAIGGLALLRRRRR